MAFTVREFVNQMYTLINPSSPTVPLHGNDQELAIRVMNQLLKSYAGTGLMITIAKTVSVAIAPPIKDIYFTDATYSTTTTQTEIVSLTALSPSFTVVDGGLYSVGDLVTGGGLSADSTIISIFGNIVTLNNNAAVTGLSNLTFTHDSSDPTVAYIKEGRLANINRSWLQLSGVTYPLIHKSVDEFLSAWKYEPLQGLPRFIITFPDTNIVRAQLYPAPSQGFIFFCRGKFQLSTLTANDDMSELPEYYQLYLMYAVAKYVSKFKGRASAWTPDLEAEYRELKDNIEASSEIDVSIAGDEQSLLNGAWRIRAGI